MITKQMGGLMEGVSNRSKDVFVTSSTAITTKYLSIYEQVTRITLANAKNLTVYLPSVKEARGLVFDIAVVSDGGAASLSVADLSDDAAWANLVCSDVADYVTVFSNGFEWRTLVTQNDAS